MPNANEQAEPGSKTPISNPLANANRPPYDEAMEARIAKLEEFAADTRERLVKIETRLEQTATKADLANAVEKLTRYIGELSEKNTRYIGEVSEKNTRNIGEAAERSAKSIAEAAEKNAKSIAEASEKHAKDIAEAAERNAKNIGEIAARHTKEIGEVRTEIHRSIGALTRWIAATVIGVSAVAITVLTIVLNNANHQAPGQTPAAAHIQSAPPPSTTVNPG